MSEQLPEVTVRLMGKAAELMRAQHCGDDWSAMHEVKVGVKSRTPRGILREIAEQNPLIADQLVRADGTPRASTRVLLDGKPPASLDTELETRRQRVMEGDREIVVIIFTGPIIIIVFLPCDG